VDDGRYEPHGFGPAVADVGNRFLRLLDSPWLLTGNPALGSSIGLVDDPDAVLARAPTPVRWPPSSTLSTTANESRTVRTMPSKPRWLTP
jgi:hypothetical protein